MTSPSSSKDRLAPSVFTILEWAVVALMILGAGLLTCWQLWEQDVFWQVRAGDEILAGQGLPRVDRWSFTVNGQPWLDFEWLSSVVMRLVWGLGGVPALVIARAVGSMLLLAVLGALVIRSVDRAYAFACTTLLLPLGYLVCSSRLQIRPDLFVLLLFALLLLLWRAPMKPTGKRFVALGLILLGANLHAGTVPFLVVVSVAHVLPDETISLARRLFWCVLFSFTGIATPYGTQLWPVLWEQFRYSQFYLLANSDQEGFVFSQRFMSSHGLGPWIWLAWCVVGWMGLLHRFPWKDVQGVVRFAPLLVGGLFTVMAVLRVRAIPYHFIFFAPYVAVWLAHGLQHVARLRVLVGVGAVALLVVVGVNRNLYAVPAGLGVWKELWPVGSVAFVKRAKPLGNILHSHGVGGYMVWELKEYPTFVDTRDPLFRHLHRDIVESGQSPTVMHALCERWNINTAIMPIPKGGVAEDGTLMDSVAGFFPYDRWGIVSFDDTTMVHVRRRPEHQHLLETSEYRVLLPHLPPDAYLRFGARTAELDARLVQEIERCRKEEPENVTCACAQSAWWRTQGDPNRLQDAYALMEGLRRKGWQDPWYMMERRHVASALGKHQEVQEIDRVMTE